MTIWFDGGWGEVGGGEGVDHLCDIGDCPYSVENLLE